MEDIYLFATKTLKLKNFLKRPRLISMKEQSTINKTMYRAKYEHVCKIFEFFPIEIIEFVEYYYF